MARGGDKVEARVHAVVHNVAAVHPALLLEVRVIAGLDVLDDRLPATKVMCESPWTMSRQACAPVGVVDKVTKAGRVNHIQAKTHANLLELCRRQAR